MATTSSSLAEAAGTSASARVQVPRIKNTVYNQIVALGISEEVARAASEIYNKSGKHISGNTSKTMRLLYECCYNGYIKLGIRPDPVALGKKFGISSKKSTNVRSENVYVEPSVHIDECVDFLAEYRNGQQLEIDSITIDPEIIKEQHVLINSDLPPITALLAGTTIFVMLLDKAAPDWWDKHLRSDLIKAKDVTIAQLKKAIAMLTSKLGDEIDRIAASYTF